MLIVPVWGGYYGFWRQKVGSGERCIASGKSRDEVISKLLFNQA